MGTLECILVLFFGFVSVVLMSFGTQDAKTSLVGVVLFFLVLVFFFASVTPTVEPHLPHPTNQRK